MYSDFSLVDFAQEPPQFADSFAVCHQCDTFDVHPSTVSYSRSDILTQHKKPPHDRQVTGDIILQLDMGMHKVWLCSVQVQVFNEFVLTPIIPLLPLLHLDCTEKLTTHPIGSSLT